MVESTPTRVKKLMCPRCGGEKFQLGPRGGASQNIRCRCGQKLNVCRLPGGTWWMEEVGIDSMGGEE